MKQIKRLLSRLSKSRSLRGRRIVLIILGILLLSYPFIPYALIQLYEDRALSDAILPRGPNGLLHHLSMGTQQELYLALVGTILALFMTYATLSVLSSLVFNDVWKRRRHETVCAKCKGVKQS